MKPVYPCAHLPTSEGRPTSLGSPLLPGRREGGVRPGRWAKPTQLSPGKGRHEAQGGEEVEAQADSKGWRHTGTRTHFRHTHTDVHTGPQTR